MRESQYQQRIVRLVRDLFPDCIVLKNDPTYYQGFPDLTIFWHDKWACLEIKASALAAKQSNQQYHIDRLAKMSFASFIYPENETEVLDALQHAFQYSGSTCVSKRKQVPLDTL